MSQLQGSGLNVLREMTDSQIRRMVGRLALATGVLFSLSLLCSVLCVAAHARDLQGRLGVGYNRQFANTEATNGVTAFSLKYAMTRDIAAEAIAGLSTSSPTNSVAGLKFYDNIFLETNLNFYFTVGAGLLSLHMPDSTTPGSRSAFQFLSGLGVEFFIPGIESLGFSMEAGGSFDNATGSFAARTYGASFIDAGMHFYF